MAPRKRKQAHVRLLLIEHAPHVIDELREMFDGPEFDCEVALSVKCAFEILQERRMDAVIVDADFDGASGGSIGAVIRRLKEKDPALKVVIFNGVTPKAAQRRLRRMGADGYLSKKSDTEAISKSVRRVVGLDG